MVNRNGSNNGHSNGTGNGLVPVNGNGHKPDAAIVSEHELSGTGCRPPSPTPWGSPSTPAWSRSARAAPGAPTTTSKATPSSTRPTAYSALADGATSWSGT